MIIKDDCLNFLKQQDDRTFTACSFSPPYGFGSTLFDVRRDFKPGGKFLPYAEELSRVCQVWAINLTQRVLNGRNYPFLEELVLALETQGVELFDRWFIVKPSAMPKRGERPITHCEFVYLFTKYRSLVKRNEDFPASTAIKVKSHHSNMWGKEFNDLTPYFEEIPRQVFGLYGGNGPVLDPFAGSGTSLIEAKKLGIPYVGVEKDDYVYGQLERRMSS